MTDFFTMPGGVVNPPDSSRSTMSYAQPPGNTAPKPDDGGIVRFNTVDWEARAKVAADGAEGLREAADQLLEVGRNNYFGDLVEGDEVYRRLLRLMSSARTQFSDAAEALATLSTACVASGETLNAADQNSAQTFQS
ncbi:hypothetical protein [Gordonia otitidis]|uniref:Uncharacterized protein n=1 Tax=Gordonia otitidis (strain DSM 44809 / CCUG 52243 / JCM 12355 / NBRC 100426 / IFM 10032) TaxID=1108044 RepID=H5TM17_GORO1|nr:hypothetical protein [Gordonia otitidis]GAB34525.1 hypothetical protein GOOTI_112_00090 [Gordonia otitidis NBRC 100426]